MRIAIIALFISFSVTPIMAQEKDRYVSLELGGSGGLGSVNFEKMFRDRERIYLHFRAGFSFIPLDANNGFGFVFPIMIHAVMGGNNHFADLGVGQAFSITTKGSAFVRMPLSFGYRFQPDGKNYYLRAAYTPIISYLFNFQWEHWGGLTIGYRLKR